MSGLKIFLAWLTTVFAGSFLLPFAVIIWNGETAHGELVFIIMLVAIILSGLSSLPTLIALLVVNSVNNRKPLKVQFKYVNMTHLIMFLLTLGIGNLWLFLESYDSSYYSEFTMQIIREEMLALSGVILLYALVAVPIWSLFFKKLWIESREEVSEEPAEG